MGRFLLKRLSVAKRRAHRARSGYSIKSGQSLHNSVLHFISITEKNGEETVIDSLFVYFDLGHILIF